MLHNDWGSYGYIIKEMAGDPVRHADASVGGGKTGKVTLMHSNSAVGDAHEIWHWSPFKVSARGRGRIFTDIDIVINDGAVDSLPHPVEV